MENPTVQVVFKRTNNLLTLPNMLEIENLDLLLIQEVERRSSTSNCKVQHPNVSLVVYYSVYPILVNFINNDNS